MMLNWLRAPRRAMNRYAAPVVALALTAVLVACGGGGYLPSPLSVTEKRPLSADFTSRMSVNYSPYRTSRNVDDIANGVEVITPANVKQDLELIEAAGFGSIRLFSSQRFGQIVLDVIRDNALDLKVMLGAYPNSISAANAADPTHPTEAGNQAELDECIRLANAYSDIVKAVSVGNETMVYWATNTIPPAVMARYLGKVRAAVSQPVTTDDNWAFWDKAPKAITDIVDFASVHTYPLLDTFYDRALWDWRKEVRDGGSTFPASRNVTIKLLSETHDRNAPAMTWTLTNAWPSKLTGPTLSAKGNDFAVEQLDLVHDRMDIS